MGIKLLKQHQVPKFHAGSAINIIPIKVSKLIYVFFRKARYHRVRFSGYAPDAAFPDYHWRCDGQMFQIHLLEVLLRSLPTA